MEIDILRTVIIGGFTVLVRSVITKICDLFTRQPDHHHEIIINVDHRK